MKKPYEHDVTHEIEGAYSPEAHDMLVKHDIKVCRWRNSYTGLCWPNLRVIETPQPKDELGFFYLAHEVGHAVLDHVVPKARWLEELEADEWALDQMERLNVPVTETVRNNHKNSIRVALLRAMRNGLKRVPLDVTERFDVPLPFTLKSRPLPGGLVSLVVYDRNGHRQTRTIKTQESDNSLERTYATPATAG